ncbi:MAG: hypothetical protein EPO28_16490 [Saprospiraceae bacterium]|nr:MAG: hypothetical protein EPO28_16490 [Saprospiraceae bacterium]
MYRSNIYPKLILLVSFMVLGFSSVNAQLEFKLQLMADSLWGVYVRPDTTVLDSVSENTLVGSGQVTLVAPTGFVYSSLLSYGASWVENARVNAPPENPGRDYISFGFTTNTPALTLVYGGETLLFTFRRTASCPDSLYLIQNGVDPFDQLPNSAGSNPGNDLTMIDYGTVPTAFYNYSGNYALSAWSCHDCDGDEILNGLEDTNGDGGWDPGIDTSNLCDPCDPIHVEFATIDYLGDANIICAGDAVDTAWLVVTIEGGWVPYTVIYSDGTQSDTVTNFRSGDSIAVIPTSSLTYTLQTVIDSFNCEINPDSLAGNIPISVQGPISITADPVNVTECSANSTSFSATAANAGDGTIFYNWQVNSGSGWADITNGTPYSTAQTATLNISNVAGLHGYQYRVKINTERCDTVFSAAATLSVEGPITVTSNPPNRKICDGSSTTFPASAANAGATGTLTYLWQVNTGAGWADLANGAPYSGVATNTLTLTGATVSLDSNLYRLKVFTGQCDTIYTNSAMLDIEGPLTFTIQPADVSNCAGNEVFFTTAFTNAGGGTGAGEVNIQWQVNSGSGWTDLADLAPYNGVQTDTLAITNVLGLDGYTYRVYINTGTCSNVFSNAATLNVNGNVTFTDMPDDITVCSGNDTMFVVAASIPQGTFTYNWQYSDDLGTTWVDISPPSGVFTVSAQGDTLFVSNVGTMYNRWFRAQAISSSCDPVNSDEARLSIEGPVSVTTNPVSQTTCSGNSITFSSVIANPGVAGSTIYRWQVSTDGGTNWSNLTNNAIYNGTGTANLSISNVAGLYNYQYRLSARTSTCNIIYTAAATLTVEGPVAVTAQPVAVETCSADAASFSATVVNSGAGTMTHQWQVTTDGTNWTNLTDAGVYTGTSTQTLNISSVAGLYGRCYRLRTVTGSCLEVFSNKACLSVEGPIAIVNQPDTVTQCSGSPVLFMLGTTNGSTDNATTNYQWQESTDGGTTWANLSDGSIYNGVQTDTMSIANTTGMDFNDYRVLVWTAHCDTLTSQVAQLLIEGPVTVIDEPDNITECSGSDVTFQATISNAGLGTLLYQWERSCDGGTTWGDVTNGGANGYSGATTSALVVTDVAGLDSCRFRLRYYTDNCVNDYTNYAVVTVEGPISIDVLGQPVSDTVCSGGTANFNVDANNTGSGQITYQWQIQPSGLGTWTNITNNSVYNGTSSSNLSVVVAGFNGAKFRVLIQTANCSSVVSDSALLVVEGPVSFTDQPDDVTQCSAEAVTFIGAAGVAVGNSGTITYQWQSSSDGLNWVDVSNGGAPGYAGATTNTLTITNVAGLNNRRYRLAARTTECNPVYSNPAKLTVEGPLTLVNPLLYPADWITCSDKEAVFFAKFNNGGQGVINYQWQQSTDGGLTWADLSNATVNGNVINGVSSDTLSISPVSGLGGTMYRVRGWTGTCDTLTSQEATLEVEGPLEFTLDPVDYTACSAGGANFTVTVANPGAGTVQYQWQRSTNGGATWTNLTNVSPYSGVTTNTLTLSNIAGLGNNKFRCRVKTPNCEWIASVNATLIVEGPITISIQPADATVCSNIGHLFTSTVTNPGSGVMAFQWQVSSDAGTNWAPLTNTGIYQGTKTEDLALSLVEGLDGYMYRLVISTGTCADTTNEVILTVLDACTTGTCDFDLDGTINNVDADDDNDQVTDYWEDWMTAHNIIDGWYYLDSNGDTLAYSNCSTDSDADGILDNQEDPDGDNINNGEETDGDGVFDGDPLDPCDPVLGPTCIGIHLAIKVNLQGAHIGNSPTDTLMRDDLRTKGLIPLNEPYTAMSPKFKHYGGGGGEVIADSAGILGVTGANAIVDWVFVELRGSLNLDSIYYTRSALVQRDGDVVDVDGLSTLSFPTANAGSFYVVVRHRNHLGVMTAEALDLSPIVQSVDFTDDAFLNNGTYAQIDLNGKMAMWAGDLNADGRSIYQGPGNDVLTLFSTVVTDQGNTGFIANYISSGYLGADINLDGRAIYQGPGNDRALVLFNVVLNYPANASNLANYVLLEQLP